MDLPTAVRTCFSKYVDFNGRARRSEYWWFFLAYVIAIVVAQIVDAVLNTSPIIYLVAVLAFLLPVLAVGVRRLHDTSRSGWWILIGLIPLVGTIVLIVFYVQDSHADNQFGPSPKGAMAPGGDMGGGYQPNPYS